MPRPRSRVCLEDGLKLDLNRLIQLRLIRPGYMTMSKFIRWSYAYTGEEIASGFISAGMENAEDGWLRLQIGKLEQSIELRAEPRHFGGRQWYFICPVSRRKVSVLWYLPGARHFASRHAWRGQVAYKSQFETPTDRAHRGQDKIKQRLIGNTESTGWNFPEKPKWMRWHTYNRHVEKYEAYDLTLDAAMLQFAMKMPGWPTDFDL